MISYKIVLVGQFGVGKTSLIRRFVQNYFSEEYLSTIGVTISKKTIDNATIMIWDIEGETEFKPIFKQYLKGSKGFILVADLLRKETIDSIQNHINLCHSVIPEAPIAIALNKCDMPFRDAYKITGELVSRCQESGVDLSEVSLDVLQEVDSRIGEDVLEFLNLRNSMNARISKGGTATSETVKQLEYFKEWIKDL